jgi:hypothetical protein
MMNTTLYTEISLRDLEAVVKTVISTSQAHIEGDSILFEYRDREQKLIVGRVSEIDSQRLRAAVVFPAPDDYALISMVVANSWNQGEATHGTFAYVAVIEEKTFLVLESHLMLRGGVRGENIRSWIANLNDHIDSFEDHVTATVQQTGNDSALIKGKADAFWKRLQDKETWKGVATVAGTFAGVFADSFLESRKPADRS